ncbi:MAG: Asp-tRNA(Asn)/Glu-tRNA(Gln) amidotransferase subunit GatC [Candidatus Omnitrophica bacterium]|nr:Asp-tRNA(Asn)/Glu-tRNA(Gln) amidotransferase subunit GatC [Candidatus Omnitrophota bacterium]MCM8790395.1 Asp-tRNA(Asn)/Glu-tRNA(Gln) amidotransferase subunit GatC [Candidatus Omnitrophota bacterium]
MPLIDKRIVKHVALLSRLELNDRELELYSSQLASIIGYISKLNEIDTTNVPPTSHAASNLKNVFRKDVLRQSLDIKDVLSNAPARYDNFFKVPQVIEGK